MSSVVKDLCDSFEDIRTGDKHNKKDIDQLKGFAYLETFEELLGWHEDAVDPLHKANTPLFKRSTEAVQTGNKSKSKVMLVHDYAGGYNDYEACQGASVGSRELYSCRHLQSVDTFVYFSHKLVTVPPPTWTNTCHRNGVITLGTFIVEPGSTEVERILEEDHDGSFWVAKKLAQIAKTYGFDGWLINIETSFPPFSWSRHKLERFLKQLRIDVGAGGKLVWYDALTPFNFVWYQNSLNHLNLPFALAAGSFLSNYAWTPEVAKQGTELAEQSGLGIENLYFGIDVWAQNTQRDPRHPRTTWPKPGGGGTGTGLGMRALKGFTGQPPGAGIFAPAWSFEHFSGAASAVDDAMWLGTYLPNEVSCDCDPEKPHSAVPYQQNGIAAYSQTSSAGTDVFFHTSFRTTFSPKVGGDDIYAHVGAQDSPITPRKMELISNDLPHDHIGHLSTNIEHNPARCVLQVTRSCNTSEECATSGRLSLLQLGITRKQKSLVVVKYRRLKFQSCRISLVIEATSGPSMTIELDKSDEESTARALIQECSGHVSGASLAFDCSDTAQLPMGTTTVAEIYSITIHPWLRSPTGCELIDLTAQYRGPPDLRHLRLRWNIEHLSQAGTSDVPTSDITGPCAYFTIYRNGNEMGRAYALEYIVSDKDSIAWKADGMSIIKVEAIGFDGSILGSRKNDMPAPHDVETEWVLVTPASERESFL